MISNKSKHRWAVSLKFLIDAVYRRFVIIYLLEGDINSNYGFLYYSTNRIKSNWNNLRNKC